MCEVYQGNHRVCWSVLTCAEVCYCVLEGARVGWNIIEYV
jgi:hypothetical protein